MEFIDALSKIPGIPAYVVVFVSGIGVCYKLFKDFSRQNHLRAKDHLEAMSNVFANPKLKKDPLILEHLFLFVYGVSAPYVTIRFVGGFRYPSEAFWRYSKAKRLIEHLTEDAGFVFRGRYIKAGYRTIRYWYSTISYFIFSVGALLSFLTMLILFMMGHAMQATAYLMMAMTLPLMAWLSLEHQEAIHSANVLVKMTEEHQQSQRKSLDSRRSRPRSGV